MDKSYRIGQMLVTTHDQNMPVGDGSTTVFIPKDSPILIGADGMAHHLNANVVQRLPADAEVSGYDAAGLAAYLFSKLEESLPMSKALAAIDTDRLGFQTIMVMALNQIGL